MSQSDAPNNYYDEAFNAERIAAGQHRGRIGGLWDVMGPMQLDIMLEYGLKPHHRVIDLGCGSFRAGVHLARYLDPLRYYGVDISRAILDAGYEHEIVRLGLEDRFPRSHTAVNAEFDISSFGVPFDFGMAQSLFTHLPIRYLGDCLSQAAPHFLPGGKFLITCFLVEPAEFDQPIKHAIGGITTKPDQDPYHYTVESVEALAAQHPDWRLELVGDWKHPRDQQLLVWHKLS